MAILKKKLKLLQKSASVKVDSCLLKDATFV